MGNSTFSFIIFYSNTIINEGCIRKLCLWNEISLSNFNIKCSHICTWNMWTVKRWLIHWLAIFFPIWIWGKTINFKAVLKSELPGKTNSTSCACELPFATPFKSRCAVLWRVEPDTSYYCPAFETNPNWRSLSYHIRLNLLITCSCHFTVKSVRLGWSYPPLTLTPSSHFSPRGWKNTPTCH